MASSEWEVVKENQTVPLPNYRDNNYKETPWGVQLYRTAGPRGALHKISKRAKGSCWSA